jgi:hypothetical protein
VVYDSTRNRGDNGKGMPYLDLREFEAKAVLSFTPEAALS